MSGQSWVEVEAVFAEAVNLAAAERLALLDARCAGRPALRAEVESLLASHDGSSGFLHAAAEGCGMSGSVPPPGEPGQTIGRFRLTERIGEGGMGVVYRGERADGEFVEQVAIKLLAAPLHDPDALRRFAVERQALATLNHPDIVTLLDGGVTAAGQPYLAMKYVDGVPITEYAGRGSCRSTAACVSSSGSARLSSTRTRTASCTAISSPPTSWSRRRGSRRSSTSASRSCWRPVDRGERSHRNRVSQTDDAELRQPRAVARAAGHHGL